MRFLFCAAFALVGAMALNAQESRPASRPDGSIRFRKVGEVPAFPAAAIMVRASSGTDVITILRDGVAYVSVENRSISDVGEEPETRRANWTGKLSLAARKEIEALNRRAPLSFGDLLDRARIPVHARPTVKVAVPPANSWPERHQESDGSWSPSDFDWYCNEENPPVCTGAGQESFRVAATALMTLGWLHAGYGGGPDRASGLTRKAMSYLRAQHGRDGSFAEMDDPAFTLTHVFAAIAFSRAVVLGQGTSFRVRRALGVLVAHQNEDGSFGKEMDEARRVSATVWALLAMKAGETAGVAIDDCAFKRALSWIEQAVGAIQAREGVDLRTLARSRAARSCAQAAANGDAGKLAEDVQWLVATIENDNESIRDAETLLFGSLAARKLRNPLFDQWNRQIRSEVIDTQCKDGCQEGTWTTPSIWSEQGGRLVSTALMAWSLELYYRYPKAYWLD